MGDQRSLQLETIRLCLHGHAKHPVKPAADGLHFGRNSNLRLISPLTILRPGWLVELDGCPIFVIIIKIGVFLR
jgi:hypothetical protein